MKKKKSSAAEQAQKPSETIDAALEIIMETFAPPTGYVLCLKSLPANLKAYEGFQWPEIGHVKAPDWKPTERCGNGLHAFRWGTGDSDLACLADDAKWLVLQVKEDGIIDLNDKVKFEECQVLYCGERDIAVSIIQHHAPAGTAVMFATVTGGYGATVTGGYGATVTGGYGATVTGGSRATVTGGDGATVTGGYGATVTGGDGATVTGGYGATVTGQLWSILIVEYWDNNDDCYKKKAALVDGVSFLPGVKYRLNSEYEFEQINETEA